MTGLLWFIFSPVILWLACWIIAAGIVGVCYIKYFVLKVK